MDLAIEKRETTTSPETLRRSGRIPGVIYGRSEPATPISVERKAFDKVFHEAGESTVIGLQGLGGVKDALIHEVSIHPVSGEPLHIDFYVIEKGQTVTVAVPLEFVGVSPAVKDLGGILVKVMHDVEIECQPKDLPAHIDVDLSKLATFDDKIVVGDLPLPSSATVHVDTDEVVAMVTQAQEEVESTPMDISQIESSVERGKKEEEPQAE